MNDIIVNSEWGIFYGKLLQHAQHALVHLQSKEIKNVSQHQHKTKTNITKTKCRAHGQQQDRTEEDGLEPAPMRRRRHHVFRKG